MDLNDKANRVWRGRPLWHWGVAVVIVIALVIGVAIVIGLNKAEPQPSRKPPALLPNANVNVGLLTDIPGWSDFDPDSNRWSGFQYDLMNRLSNNLKLTTTPVTVTFENRPAKLAGGEVDIMLANFSMTDARCRDFMCIGPYMLSDNGVMTRGTGPQIHKTAEMKHKAVCSMTGTTSLEKLNEQLGGSITIVEKIGLRQCVRELEQGRVDAVSTAKVDLLGFTQDKRRDLRLEDFTFGTQDRFAIALRKDAAVEDCQKIHDELRAFIASPDWAAFFSQHFPGEPPAPHKPELSMLGKCPDS